MSLQNHSNLYLSDDLIVSLTLDRAYLNTYFDYTITKKEVFSSDESIIYTGRVYYYEYGQRIYLNDIISTHSTTYNIPTSENVVGGTTYVNQNKDGVFQVFKINLSQNGSFVQSYEIGPVLSYYKDLDLPKGSYIDLNSTGFYNVLEQRTNILPRIPKLDSYENNTPGFSNNFYFSALWIPTNSFFASSTIGSQPKYKLVSKNNDGLTLNYVDYDGGNFVHSENFDGYDLSQLTSADAVEIGICAINADDIESEVNYKKVANIDICPADYYLIWYDRTGAYQCQPFSKRSLHSENITSNNLVNTLEETRPYEKLVENKWTINSDWLTDEEYKAYESILTSPYHYLYDSKLNTGWWVNCGDKTYTQKTFKNQKRMFNMTVNLTANKNQRMLY